MDGLWTVWRKSYWFTGNTILNIKLVARTSIRTVDQSFIMKQCCIVNIYLTNTLTNFLKSRFKLFYYSSVILISLWSKFSLLVQCTLSNIYFTSNARSKKDL